MSVLKKMEVNFNTNNNELKQLRKDITTNNNEVKLLRKDIENIIRSEIAALAKNEVKQQMKNLEIISQIKFKDETNNEAWVDNSIVGIELN
jgi:hypothetical protein